MAAPRSHTAADIFYGRSSSPPSSSLFASFSSISAATGIFLLPLRSPFGASTVSRRWPARGQQPDIVPHTRPGQPPLHAATSYLHEKGVASNLLPPSAPWSGITPAPAMPDEAPLEAPSSVNTVHHYRRGSLYFKGHGARLFTLVPRHFGHGQPPLPLAIYKHRPGTVSRLIPTFHTFSLGGKIVAVHRAAGGENRRKAGRTRGGKLTVRLGVRVGGWHLARRGTGGTLQWRTKLSRLLFTCYKAAPSS